MVSNFVSAKDMEWVYVFYTILVFYFQKFLSTSKNYEELYAAGGESMIVTIVDYIKTGIGIQHFNY